MTNEVVRAMKTEEGDENEGGEKRICQLPHCTTIHVHVPKTEMY